MGEGRRERENEKERGGERQREMGKEKKIYAEDWYGSTCKRTTVAFIRACIHTQTPIQTRAKRQA